jgi:hypothetical protein
LDAGGFAKQGIKKYSPDGIERSGCTLWVELESTCITAGHKYCLPL